MGVATLPSDRAQRPSRLPARRLAVYVIVDGDTPLSLVAAALAGGAGAIQFRDKRLRDGDAFKVALRVRDCCAENDTLFIVNDRVDLALATEADGVHLGQDDLPAAVARKLLGPEAIIGISCRSVAAAQQAAAVADYIGTGAIYGTQSKLDAGPAAGTEMLTQIRRSIELPVVGIGGIRPGLAARVIAAGADGVAVYSAVTEAPDPQAVTAGLLLEVRRALSNVRYL